MAPVVTHRALGIRVAIDAAKASGSFALGIDLQNWAETQVVDLLASSTLPKLAAAFDSSCKSS